ncbi:DUF4394 domain-containing protein [bacterium]|nr:DUF4394 domain-containing protein [bacterium]
MAAAVLTSAGSSKLYRINLTTGAASLRADLAGLSLGGLSVIDVAVANLRPADFALANSGLRLTRFLLETPGTSALATVSGVVAGERLVGMDLRPRTGQLLALGIDALNDRGTLYRLEPQSMGTTAVATPIGTPGQIAFVDSAGSVIDLSDVPYGVDVNPAADRLRVVDGTGLNFRVNPDTGAAIDGAADAGTNPDGMIAGPLGTQLAATAYTNSSSGTTLTTQYTLDQLGGFLNVQNPPNNGTQTLAQPVLLNAQPFTFGGGVGFDIPPGVAPRWPMRR